MIVVRLQVGEGESNLPDFHKMASIFRWLEDRDIKFENVYKTDAIVEVGQFCYNRAQSVELLYVGVPDDLALLAKLTWGGK